MRKKRIVMLVQPLAEQDYWTERIFGGIRQEAARQEAAIMAYGSVQALMEGEKDVRRVLLIGYSHQWFGRALLLLKEAGIEPIFVSAQTPVDARYSAVCFSIPSCLEEALRYLYAAGRHRIAFFGYNPDSPADGAKAEVFLRLIREQSLKGCEVIPAGGEKTIRECVDDFVERADQFDAVVCANDPVAIHLIDGLLKGGYRVPEDHYIIGIGNLNITCVFHIPITSISFNYFELGRQAALLYMQTEGDESGVHYCVSLPCELLVRKSTACFQPFSVPQVVPDLVPDSLAEYYSDPSLIVVNQLEGLLQHCDDWDHEILYALSRGETYQQMAQRLNFSERAIKYRVKKLILRAGVNSRSELRGLLEPLMNMPYRHSPGDKEG